MRPVSLDIRNRYRQRHPAFVRSWQARPVVASASADFEEMRRLRVSLVFLIFVIGFLALTTRAVYLTVFCHDDLTKEAEIRHNTAIELAKPRGEIIDRNGERLAITIDTDSIFVDPKFVKTPPETAHLLATILKLDEATVLQKLQSSRRYEWIKRKVPPEQIAVLDKTDPKLLLGVGRIKESERRYPFAGMAAAVLGFTNIDLLGLEGLEQKFDKTLAGEPGHIAAMKDAKGQTFYTEGVRTVGRQDGRTLRLTLDSKIQWFAETALDGVVEKHHPAATWALVMDVRTGEILAMANRPSFLPEQAGRSQPFDRRNHPTLDMYEPGSTMKPITVAIALEDGKVRLDEKIDCQGGSWSFGGHIIHDTHAHGALTPAEIIRVSSNIGAAKLALRVGNKGMFQGFRNFGFGQRTGVDFSVETTGQMRNYETWYPIDLATQGYGQGISVTSIQLLNAMATLGNGGRLMKPYLVSEVIAADGTVIQRNNPQIVRRVLSEKVAREVVQMMTLVTQEGGTGTQAALKDFLVAGKTGTAYKVDPRTGKYHPTKRVGSFVGLVPGEDPRLGIIVVVDEPAGTGYGGIVAAPAFREIAVRSLDYLGVFAARQKEENKLAAVLESHATRRLDAEVDDDPVLVTTEEDVMPNFLGLSMRMARKLADQLKLNVSLQGSGVAVRQDPAPGARLTEPRQVTVEFSPQG
ncbi:MAG: transpeptidase family protein [Myxococcales bacterium]|nr:transpeptidase family protein [Myxococcales bacterium]